jgi:phage-related protein
LPEFQVVYYDLPNGKMPSREFIVDLDAKMRAKMFRAIQHIAEVGSAVREPYSRHLQDGIFEVRAEVGTDISRVLYFFYTGKRFVLTHGFIKKTQKTPPSEIERAKKYRAEYLSRKESTV